MFHCYFYRFSCLLWVLNIYCSLLVFLTVKDFCVICLFRVCVCESER